MNELREQLAALVHDDIWTGWVQGVIFRGKRRDANNGELIIDSATVDRWMRQIFTDYWDLENAEQDIDRMVADKILAVIERSGKKFCECGEKE